MRTGKFNILIIITALTALAISQQAAAENARELVRKGNDSFRDGNYREALEFYDRASVKEPESPIIFFNRGDALYRNGEFEKAADQFMKTANRTKDLGLEARAWYNMGNSSMMLGKRQSDSDMKKALEHYRESVSRYQTALKKDSTLHDAAVNMEIARVLIKDLLDKIKKQQEMKRKRQEQVSEIVDSLISIAKRQDRAGREASAAARDREEGKSGWKRETGQVKKEQEQIENKTADIREKMGGLPGAEQAPSIQRAISHADSSLTSQNEALEKLEQLSPREATAHQDQSLDQIMKAIAALTGDNNQGQRQDQSGDQNRKGQEDQKEAKPRQNQQKKNADRNDTARQILAEEEQNREKRRKMRQKSSGYRPVEKDW